MNEEKILIYSQTVFSFFNKEVQVSLPDYQRPYVWDEGKLEQLLEDWNEHFFENKSEYKPNVTCYYLGTVLLYKKSNTEFEIIDGQQRVTSLLIIDYVINENESFLKKGKWNLEFSSLISSSTIIKNLTYLKIKIRNDLRLKEKLNDIFEKNIFTVIETHSEDEAFTFFDSQNNRGVSLSAVDFLKSYHLRELKKSEGLQRIFAKQWDKNNNGQFLNILFNEILWRNRNWKGNNLIFENKDEILKSFQKKTIKSKDNTVDLYPNIFNSLSSTLRFTSDEGVSVNPNSLYLQTKAEQYPFSIRQPIQKGIGFFLYTEKYLAIYNQIFKGNKYSDFINAYNQLIKNTSPYFRTFFELTAITYFDKFKDNKLLNFALWFDYMIGSYRINQHTIVKQTVIKILRDKPQNLLDVIEMAYIPEDVFEFMNSNTDNSFYDVSVENLGSENGIRNRYRKNNLHFYQKNENPNQLLTYKFNWINEYLNR